MSQSGIIGRPRGRPFAKGQSGNPGGRPIKPLTIEVRKLEQDVRMLARDRGAEAIDKLVALMRGVVRVEIDRKPVEMLVPPMTQLAAANAMLDRGYGRPAQAVEMSGRRADPSRLKRPRHTTSSSVVLRASLGDSERTGTLKKLLSSSTEDMRPAWHSPSPLTRRRAKRYFRGSRPSGSEHRGDPFSNSRARIQCRAMR